MVRKITLLLLLFIGFNSVVKAQVRDGVHISMPYGTDTTCPGEQLTFIATETVDTFTGVQYHWYTDNTFTGVIIDTFHTTALVDGDSVYCRIVFTNSFGAPDSVQSNTIIIHRSSSFAPRIVIALTVGSNPDCAGHPLTFTAFPVNGGVSPGFQWMVNGDTVIGSDSVTITRYFNSNDTVTCQMVSNSACAFPFPLTDTSNAIIVSHDSLHASITVGVTRNPICAGTKDTFFAVTASTGLGSSIAWYVDSVLIPTALGPDFSDSTLANGNLVYAILNAPDACVTNHHTVSNIITMTVISLAPTSAWDLITAGTNPGCLDSPVTFTGHYLNFGTAPTFDWYVNGVLALHNSLTFTNTFNDNDVVTFKVNENDHGCYTHDTLTTAPFLMIRDSTPVTPWLSLISDLLVVNNGGHFTWYYNNVNAYTGSIMPTVINQTYNPHTLGYYYVVKDSANCPSLPSNIIYISLLGVKSLNTTNVNIFPNPTNGILTIDWGNRIVEDMEMDVYNMVGQPVHHEEIKNASQHQADLSALPEGNYIMTLRDEDGSRATYKITISK